jgi:IMP dehydrogenase
MNDPVDLFDDEERSGGLARKFGRLGLTFDDVMLMPASSDVLPHEADTSSRFTPDISLAIPIVSAAMDTVTESRMAIALARLGGIGVIHRNLPPEDQVAEVDRVKRSESGMITDPVTLRPTNLVQDALDLMSRFHISGVPITDDTNHLVGILTNRDLRFETNPSQPIAEVMTREGLMTAPVGTTLEQATELFRVFKVEKLPVVDANGLLRGLITIKDLQKRIDFPEATKDDDGRLRVAAAIGTGPEVFDRAKALIDAGVDALVVDTAHGHATSVAETVRELRRQWDGPLVAGNVATAGAAEALIDAGADAI